MFQAGGKKNNSEQVGISLISKRSFYSSVVKRCLDLLFSVLALVLLSPIILLSALAVLLSSGSPVIFTQERLGYKGKVFRIYKFRSMVRNAEHTGSGVYSEEGDERVTKVGRILRATSIDELPQLLNIIKGDMSLIGPRPPLTYHPWPIEKYSKEQLHMFDVLPGITGWAQINGRKAVEWHKRIELNCWYADHVSFSLDCRILFTTFFKVLSRADNVNKGKTLESDPH